MKRYWWGSHENVPNLLGPIVLDRLCFSSSQQKKKSIYFLSNNMLPPGQMCLDPRRQPNVTFRLSPPSSSSSSLTRKGIRNFVPFAESLRETDFSAIHPGKWLITSLYRRRKGRLRQIGNPHVSPPSMSFAVSVSSWVHRFGIFVLFAF